MAKEIRPLQRYNEDTEQTEIFYPATTTDAIADVDREQSLTETLEATAFAGEVVGDPTGDWNKGDAEDYIDKEIAKVKNWVSNTPVTNVVTVTSLPASGNVNTLYRVAGTNTYSEYGWDGTQFVKLDEKEYGIDDEPTAGSDNLVKSGGVAIVLGYDKVYSNNAVVDKGYTNNITFPFPVTVKIYSNSTNILQKRIRTSSSGSWLYSEPSNVKTMENVTYLDFGYGSSAVTSAGQVDFHVKVVGINDKIEKLKDNQADLAADLAGFPEEYYTDDTLSDSLYNSFNAELGTTFAPTPTSYEDWYCIKLNVHKGEQIQVCASTRLSIIQRPYVVTNLQNEVIRTSPVGGDYTNADTFTAEHDGYLYVNNNSAQLPMTNFFVKVSTSLTLDNLREISIQVQDDVSDLASRIIPDDNNPLSIVKETAGLTSVIHKLGVIGASFTNGGHNKTSGTFPISIAREFSWPQRLAKLCGITAYNFGQPGMWSKQWLDDVGGYYTQMGQADYACDAYIISFASNDVGKADYPLGTIADVHIGDESENAPSFYGYLSQIIARCKEVIPRSYLFMLTYPYNYSQTDTNGYNQAMRDLVAAYREAGYYIYLIDYAAYGMKISEAQSKGMYRHAHFVGTGYQYMTYEICTYIDWIIRHNMEDFKDIAFVQTDAEYNVYRVYANEQSIASSGTVNLTSSQFVRIEGNNMLRGITQMYDQNDEVVTPLYVNDNEAAYLLNENGQYHFDERASQLLLLNVSGVVVPDLPLDKAMRQLPSDSWLFSRGINEIRVSANCLNYPYTSNDDYPNFRLYVYGLEVEPMESDFAVVNCTLARYTWQDDTMNVGIGIEVLDLSKPAYITYQGFIIAVFNYTA